MAVHLRTTEATLSAQMLAIILAAGKGTRMRSAVPKVMHKVGGLEMVRHVIAATQAAGIKDCALVVSEGADWAQKLEGAPATHVQDPPLGTAHAVLAARTAVTADHDAVLVLFADNPLMRAETIANVCARVEAGADVVVLAFQAADPAGYGRVLLDENGVAAIREERDASDAERQVTLCNSGIMAIRTGAAFHALDEIGCQNAKGEYYLTDLVAIARAKGLTVAVEEAPADEVLGVNDRAQLAEAEAVFQQRMRAAVLHHATLEAPQTVFFSHDTVLHEDVHVEPHVVFGPGVEVARGARVRAFSHLEGATVGEGASIGPYARLRPGSDIGPKARVGNFV
ncbi:MAG: NTP transferase domain-containing protein, partial [Pseudomonadota bacterium]